MFDVSNKTSAVPAQSANAHASKNHYNNSPSSSSSSQISSNATQRPYYIDQRLPIKSTTTATKPSSPNKILNGSFPHITHVQKQNHPPPTAHSHKVMSTTSSMLSVSSSSSPTFTPTQLHTPFNVGAAAAASSSSMNCSSSSHYHALGATAATYVTDGAGSSDANATTTPTTSNNNRASWSIKLSTTCKQVGVTLGQHVRNLAKPRNTNPKQERYTLSPKMHKSTKIQSYCTFTP